MTRLPLFPEDRPSEYCDASARPSLGKLAPSERLGIVASELNLLFAGNIEGSEPFTSLTDTDAPVLQVGRSIGLKLTIEIKPSGLFAISENTPCETALVTASEERLIDYIVGLVSGPSGERTPRAVDAAVDMLTGRTLVEVGNRLIGRTLLHYRGDRSRTAFALGIDEATLQANLKSLLVDRLRMVSALNVPQ